MAKPKAKSLQQKLGFFDEDLKSPDHDTILKWLDKNIDIVLNSIYNFREWNEKHVKEFQKQAISIKKFEINRLTKELQEKESFLSNAESDLIENKEKLKVQLENEKLQEESQYKSSKWTLKKITRNEQNIKDLKSEIPKIKEQLELINEFNGLDESELPERRKPRVLNKKWEYTVTNQSYNAKTGYQSTKSVIGFIDMKIDFTYTKLYIKGLDEEERLKEKLTWGQSEKKYVNARYNNTLNTHSLLIEVKTKIPSLGELFRQLNTYKEYESGDYLVVCPDDSEKEIIRSQGFMFFKFEGD